MNNVYVYINVIIGKEEKREKIKKIKQIKIINFNIYFHVIVTQEKSRITYNRYFYYFLQDLLIELRKMKDISL